MEGESEKRHERSHTESCQESDQLHQYGAAGKALLGREKNDRVLNRKGTNPMLF